MKKFIYNIFVAAIAAMALVSCQKEQESYKPGTADPDGCFGVYFPSQEASGSHTYDPSMERSVSITVSRTNTSGAATVPFTTTVSEEGVFNFGTISFADGQSETELEVTFPNAGVGTEYSFSVQLDDDSAYVSHYNSGAIALDFSVLIVTWEYFLNPETGDKAVVTFTQNFWGETAFAYIKYYEVDGVRTCQTETFLHEYNGEQYEGYGFFGTAEAEGEGEWTFTWYSKNTDSAGNQYIWLHSQPTGWHHSSYDADVWVYDAWGTDKYLRGSDVGDWLTEIQAGNYPYGYYDGNGGFFLYVQYYYMDGIGGWNQSTYDVIGIAEGFTRVDYSLALSSDYGADGVTPVYVEAGVDVDHLKYAVYEGELNSAQVENAYAAVIAGTVETETFSDFSVDEEEAIKYATLGLSPETTGTYTIVAVTYDAEGNDQNAAATFFKHVAAGDVEDYAVDLSAFTEDTPARYKELHAYDSFAYGISGSDLTDVHMGIFDESTISSYGSDYVISVVKNSTTYALDSDQLAEVNADGGYYDIASGMKPKTTYYVIVWATNGALDKVVVANYTTDKLPYVWNSLGKGTLNDGFLLPLFGDPDVTVACDVYEEANTPGLYMVTGFQLELASAFYGVDPSVLEPYEGSNWFNSEIVVDATDPAAVYIEAQEYGIYVNSTYAYVLIETEKSGTLADGVITFPTKEMYVGFTGNGKWYYGNSNGTFAITMPAAASTSAVSALPKGTEMKSDFSITDGVQEWNKPVVKYERDPQAIQVKSVKMDPVRKEKTSGRNASIETL